MTSNKSFWIFWLQHFYQEVGKSLCFSLTIALLCVYLQETEQLDLRQKMDRKLGSQTQQTKDSDEVIEEDRFSQFMTVAK